MADVAAAGVNVGYAIGRLQRALETALNHPDAPTRARAQAKVERWRAVLEGTASGSLAHGSRTPVANTPAWVTLEVAHGGFATGRYLAEGELLDHEQELLAGAANHAPGETARERLNSWYLGDAGQTKLLEAVEDARYRVELPEEGALPVVASLLARGRELEALELLTQLRPLMHRLRFYPALAAQPRPSGACVRRSSVGEVVETLRAAREQGQVASMNEALRVWNPLFDVLVALWCETVAGELPSLAREGEGQPRIVGDWPCRRWPADFGARVRAWFEAYAQASATHERCTKHLSSKSNFGRLLAVAQRYLEVGGEGLTGREVGSVRLALANTIAKHGTPASPKRTQLRVAQNEHAGRPSRRELALVLAARVAAYPANGGLPSLEPLAEPVAEGESEAVRAGTQMPDTLVAKTARALEAPIAELVERGVIASGEVLAEVLPQITAQVAAAGIEDPVLRELYGQIYAAFRRRRSLLLLDLQQQVGLEELPWVAALEPFRKADLGSQAAARHSLEQVTLLALTAFPHTQLPNPLVREMSALGRSAGMQLPLVEELAADIFMGTFTRKWAHAAAHVIPQLEGTLYARYYDLPEVVDAAVTGEGQAFGVTTAAGFAHLCRKRAAEAQRGGSSSVATSGAVIEQSQILTTHNLDVLIGELGLRARMRELAPSLAARNFAWIVRRHAQKVDTWRARLQMVKNTAYAWRQAIYLLSLCEESVALEAIVAFEGELLDAPKAVRHRLWPAFAGLKLVAEGGRFGPLGIGPAGSGAIRWLGWSVGTHWMLEKD